ncbi:hypothetical protein BDW22DRAFT_1063395 [Trametopsis cervina]|nr:hypothetical protein BDW22DRAFT_1063395 [Trametopsis cervina]
MATVAFNVRATFGALLVGGVISTFLSGAVSMQAYLYARTFPKDRSAVKFLVSVTWLLDVFHSSMVAMSLWEYLIAGFESPTVHDKIFWSLGMTVASTAILTFLVHCFFVHRLYKLSKGKLILALPIASVALFRLAAACVTTAEMIRLGSFALFLHQFRWVFTLGLVLSSVADVLIASGMCFYLKQNRTGSRELDRVIDSVIYYTIENGILTSIATILSLIFWLAMPHNLVYMGMHFAISKLYANSLLASLNARTTLRQVQSSISGQRPSIGQAFPTSARRFSRYSVVRGHSFSMLAFSADGRRDVPLQTGTKLEINVEKTIDCMVEEDGPYTPGYKLSERSFTESTPRKEAWMAS